jgi:hypothetical protein
MRWEILQIFQFPMISFSKSLNTSPGSSHKSLSRFLETDVTNPWLYMHKQLEECEDIALELAKRKKHIEVNLVHIA